MAAALTLPGGDLPYQRGGMGDHLTGMALAGWFTLWIQQKTWQRLTRSAP